MKHIDMKHAFCIAVRIALSAALLACCMVAPVARSVEVSNAADLGTTYNECDFNSDVDCCMRAADSVSAFGVVQDLSREVIVKSWMYGFAGRTPVTYANATLELPGSGTLGDLLDSLTSLFDSTLLADIVEVGADVIDAAADVISEEWLRYIYNYLTTSYSTTMYYPVYSYISASSPSHHYSTYSGYSFQQLAVYYFNNSTYALVEIGYYLWFIQGYIYDAYNELVDVSDVAASIVDDTEAIANDTDSLEYLSYLSTISSRLYYSGNSIAYYAYSSDSYLNAIKNRVNSGLMYTSEDNADVAYSLSTIVYNTWQDLNSGFEDLTDAVNDIWEQSVSSSSSIGTAAYWLYRAGYGAYNLYSDYGTDTYSYSTYKFSYFDGEDVSSLSSSGTFFTRVLYGLSYTTLSLSYIGSMMYEAIAYWYLGDFAVTVDFDSGLLTVSSDSTQDICFEDTSILSYYNGTDWVSFFPLSDEDKSVVIWFVADEDDLAYFKEASQVTFLFCAEEEFFELTFEVQIPWTNPAYGSDSDVSVTVEPETYNYGTAAYWAYMTYSALSDAQEDLTALSRLTSIYTVLSNIYEAIGELDLSVTIDNSGSLADALAEVLPDSLSLTTLKIDFSDLLDSLADFNFNIGNLADITLDVSGVVGALQEYLSYSGYSAAQLLYLCWGELSGLDVGVSVDGLEVDFSEVVEALGDIYDALTYVTDDDSLLSTASADGVAAAASTSTTYTNAQLIYQLLAKWSAYDDALDGIDSDLTKILKLLAAEDDDDFLEALKSFAQSLLDSSTLATVASSAAENLASTLLPLVVLNLTVDLFLTFVDIEPVEPEFEILLPITDDLVYTDSFTMYYVADFLPVIQASMLILYAIGLACAFKSWVTHLGGD